MPKKFQNGSEHITCFMSKTQVGLLEDRLLSSQFKKLSQSSDGLKKRRPSKKPLLFWMCKQVKNVMHVQNLWVI